MIGYTLSVVAFCALTLFWRTSRQSSSSPTRGISFISSVQLAVLAVWAMRLFYFIAKRDGSPHYQNAVKEQVAKAQKMSLFVKGMVWASVSVLYCTMFAPAAIVALHKASHLNYGAITIAVTGLMVQTLGFILEMAADRQKSLFKRNHPNECIRTGLFAIVRYPNYLGEILVWLGSFICGTSCYHKIWQWIAALIGLACITLIMIGSTKRLEAKQQERYSHCKSFQVWTSTVPILVPFLPVYTLQSTRVYLE